MEFRIYKRDERFISQSCEILSKEYRLPENVIKNILQIKGKKWLNKTEICNMIEATDLICEQYYNMGMLLLAIRAANINKNLCEVLNK